MLLPLSYWNLDDRGAEIGIGKEPSHESLSLEQSAWWFDMPMTKKAQVKLYYSSEILFLYYNLTYS